MAHRRAARRVAVLSVGLVVACAAVAFVLVALDEAGLVAAEPWRLAVLLALLVAVATGVPGSRARTPTLGARATLAPDRGTPAPDAPDTPARARRGRHVSERPATRGRARSTIGTTEPGSGAGHVRPDAAQPWVLLGTAREPSDAGHGQGPGQGQGHPRLWLALTLVVASVFFAVAGWTELMPAAAALIAVLSIEVAGPRMWRPAVAVTAALTLAGQLGLQLGWVPSVLDADAAHLVAGVVLLTSAWTVAHVGRAVNQRQRSQESVARAEARLRALLEGPVDVKVVTDAHGRLTYVSPAVERTLGHGAHRLLGAPVTDLVDPEYRPAVVGNLQEVVRAGTGASTSFDVLLVLRHRERRWFEWTVRNLLDDPLVAGLVVDQRDVTERLQHQDALAHAAAHDPLTGLANRTQVVRLLAASLPEAVPGAGVALLFLDLDLFKNINDTWGHAAGDRVLVAVAQRLRGTLRPQDHAGRLGGDEFCALLTEVRDEAEVDRVVQRIEDAVSQPVVVDDDGSEVHVGVSVGVAVTVNPDEEPSALFAAADAAMYRAKRARSAGRHLRGPGSAST